MKKVLKGVSLLLFLVIVAIMGWYANYKATFSPCILHHDTQLVLDSVGVWSKFVWGGNKSSMHLPISVEGLPYSFTFQLDLGSPNTLLHGHTLNAIAKKHHHLQQKIHYPVWLFNKIGVFEELTLKFGSYTARYPASVVLKQMGSSIPEDSLLADTIALGTMGANTFRDKVLLIDYPNQRLCILDSLPTQYAANAVEMRLNRRGKVILPMSYQGRQYDCLFDSGSSMFELLTTDNRINDFSTEANVDTIQVSAWGKMHTLTSKLLTDTVYLAGIAYPGLKIYADYRPEAKVINFLDGVDAITGNALFWNEVLAIDFKNQRLSVGN